MAILFIVINIFQVNVRTYCTFKFKDVVGKSIDYRILGEELCSWKSQFLSLNINYTFDYITLKKKTQGGDQRDFRNQPISFKYYQEKRNENLF